MGAGRNSSYVVLKPTSEVDAGYLRYLFKSAPYIAALRGTANFIRDGQLRSRTLAKSLA